MKKIEEDPNSRFEKATFNLLRSFNFIDHNLGLSISFLAKPMTVEDAYKKLANMSFNKRLDWFTRLIKRNECQLGSAAKTDFEKWSTKAERVRIIRNVYAHAIWRFNPMREGKPVSISSPVWMNEKLGRNTHEELSLGELDDRAKMVEDVFQEFMILRNIHKV